MYSYSRTKALTCDDFRGIAISPVISKVLEYCLLDRFSNLLSSSDNQFGFRKSLSCSHAVFNTTIIVDSFIRGGNTANLCSIDLYKAFDKVNHHGLYLKLLKRRISVELLLVFTARHVCIARTMPWQDVCLSVRPSVTRRYCVLTVTHILKVFHLLVAPPF